MKTKTISPLIDEKKLAEITSRSLQTLRNERCRGRGVPYYKIGRSVRYNIEDVEEYLSHRKIQTQ